MLMLLRSHEYYTMKRSVALCFSKKQDGKRQRKTNTDNRLNVKALVASIVCVVFGWRNPNQGAFGGSFHVCILSNACMTKLLLSLVLYNRRQKRWHTMKYIRNIKTENIPVTLGCRWHVTKGNQSQWRVAFDINTALWSFTNKVLVSNIVMWPITFKWS